MTVTINQYQLSDLFFNSQLCAYNALDHGAASGEDVEAALLEDAKAFCEYLGDQVDPQWLVKDFQKRV